MNNWNAMKSWITGCAGVILSGCVPVMNAKTPMPFEVGQTWELTGKSSEAQNSESFPILIRYVINRFEDNPSDGDISFLDKETITTRKDKFASYGIDYNPKTGLVVVGVANFTGSDNRYCLIDGVANQSGNTFKGYYFSGTDDDFVKYKLNKDYSRFGTCSIKKL
jgi:hypothetical protein